MLNKAYCPICGTTEYMKNQHGMPICIKCGRIVSEEEISGDIKARFEELRLLQKAFDKACEDAADGCCPYDFTGEYECELCESCSNRLGEREDMGRDAECWKNYYLQKAQMADIKERIAASNEIPVKYL